MDIRGYLRQVRALPPRIVMRKAAGLAQRTADSWTTLARDILSGSYGADCPDLNPVARISIAANDIPSDLEATLRIIGRNYLQHKFDLLGSGWVSPAYGFQAAGFLGRSYASNAPKAPDRAGNGLEAVVNRSNVARSRQIWRLVTRPDYIPIDWQLDFRSGYRWSAQRPSMLLPIPIDRGADVKVPWELGRLQHLPQLALCAIIAGAGRSGFEPSPRYVAEISDQLIDFIANNPPRFGVNWMGAMDVGIRAANIALTLALLEGAGLALAADIRKVVTGSLNDHAAFIVEHLDYSETGRSNHYIAGLGGLIWSNWLLTGSDAYRRLAFAIAEILNEADAQFLADGGNYEGSTSYHRLSAETVLFALAVVLSLDETALEGLERATPPSRPWRAPFPRLPFERFRSENGGATIIPPIVLEKLAGAARLSHAVQGADGTVVQIGDCDSGRFFKLHPTAFRGEGRGQTENFVENTLDHSGFVDAVDVLFDRESRARRMDAVLVHRLVGTGGPLKSPPVQAAADFGDLDALIARWHAKPEHSRRLRRIPLGVAVKQEEWTRTAFNDFGLYLFRYDPDVLISFRCFRAPVPGGPCGHMHDDNLAIEYRMKTDGRRDPGSFVYTPSIAQRNRYRSAAAHDVPRVRGQSLADPGSALFDLTQTGEGACLCWRPEGVAGEVGSSNGTILRILKISPDELTIYDCVQAPFKIADISPELPLSNGYGRL